MMNEKIHKSSSIILRKTTGEILLCKRSDKLKHFPDNWVFPGGKIEDPLPEDWKGDEAVVLQRAFIEMYEEVGIIPGSNKVIPPKNRKQDYYIHDYDEHDRAEFKANCVFIGKKKTPPFGLILFDAAYFIIQHELIDNLEPIADGSEIVEVVWLQPADAIQKWKELKIRLPPPILHIIRNISQYPDHFQIKTLAEMKLPIGLQTKVELFPNYQSIPFYSNTIAPFTTTNLIVYENSGESIIIDPGAKETEFDHLQEYLYTLTSTPKVLVTHHHMDHWSGLQVVETLFPNTILYGHSNTLDKIETKLQKQSITDGFITIGEKNLQIIYTPGHTDGHIMIFDREQKVLIAGDHVVGYGSAVLDPEYGNMKDYFDTTHKLIELNPEVIFPAHGPVNFNPTSLLKQYIEHRTNRESMIYQAIINGSDTYDKVIKAVYQDVDSSMWDYAKSNIKLHVEKLIADEKLNQEFYLN